METRDLMNSKARAFPLTLILILIFMASMSYGEDLSDCLVQNDIGSYKRIFDGSKGTGSGILALAGHFGEDHNDITCRISYANDEWVDVQVTQHAGGDSDKWLLHEVERVYRSEDLEPQFDGIIKEIDGDKIFTWLYGTSYHWISNNTVVSITYSDPELNQPEPFEVVRAYLAKHPSTITFTDSEAKSKAHNEKWIKDEMERRLWLCDKWFQQLDEGKIEKYKVLSEVVNDHLEVFLNYRQKYYEINAEPDKKTLFAHLQAENDKEIRKKLTEYKQWWAENKTKPINL